LAPASLLFLTERFLNEIANDPTAELEPPTGPVEWQLGEIATMNRPLQDGAIFVSDINKAHGTPRDTTADAWLEQLRARGTRHLNFPPPSTTPETESAIPSPPEWPAGASESGVQSVMGEAGPVAVFDPGFRAPIRQAP
jgi:hypothetical protein